MTPRLACATFTKFPLFFDKTGMFRVLCVSDLHARDGKWDPRLKLSLDALIRAHRPHLVFLLGDICHDGGMGSDALLHAYLADIMELCETERIPWAHIPGNHDRADTIPTEVFTAFPMNLSRRGPTELSGYGTFALPIWRHDGSEPAAMVWAFDSHTGIGAYAEEAGIDRETFALQNFPYSHDRYDSVRFDQAAWYYENSIELEALYGRKLPGVMLMHAPVAEMFLIPANPTATAMEGEFREAIGGAVWNSGLFAAAFERGDIREMVANVVELQEGNTSVSNPDEQRLHDIQREHECDCIKDCLLKTSFYRSEFDGHKFLTLAKTLMERVFNDTDDDSINDVKAAIITSVTRKMSTLLSLTKSQNEQLLSFWKTMMVFVHQPSVAVAKKVRASYNSRVRQTLRDEQERKQMCER